MNYIKYGYVFKKKGAAGMTLPERTAILEYTYSSIYSVVFNLCYCHMRQPL